MGWSVQHAHDWHWATDGEDWVLSIILPGQVYGWQICKCGQWRIRILKEQTTT